MMSTSRVFQGMQAKDQTMGMLLIREKQGRQTFVVRTAVSPGRNCNYTESLRSQLKHLRL